MIENGIPQLKPNPAPYLNALQLLGRPAGATVAVEDSVVGVQSAVKAEIGVVLGVLNRGDGEQEDAAHAAEELRAAGAYAVFDTTVDAVDWCVEHAAARVASVDAGTRRVGPLVTVAEAEAKEEVVRRYFEGVNKQDRAQISSCFAEVSAQRNTKRGEREQRTDLL